MTGALEQIEQLVASVWDDELSDARRAHLAKRLADTRFFRDRDLDGALAAHDAARERLTDPDAIAVVDARRASLLAGAGRPAEALRITSDVHAGHFRANTGRSRRCPRREPAQRRAFRRGPRRSPARRRPITPSCRDWMARRGIAQHLVNEAHAFAYCGRYREARELLEPAVERATATSALGAWIWFEMALAEVARDTGRAHEAIRRFSEVADAAPALGQHAVLVWAHVGVAQGHLLLGECVEAAAALELADEVGDSPVATSWSTRERTRAWLEACRGDLVSARQRIRETIGRSSATRCYIFELALLHDLVRLGVPGEAVEPLEALAGVHRRAARVDSTPPTHARSSARDAVPSATWSTGTRRSTRSCMAAEAAAELADLHRVHGEGRLATARPAFGRYRRAGRWSAHPGAGPRGRRRAAHGTRARGGAARRRRAQQPRHR